MIATATMPTKIALAPILAAAQDRLFGAADSVCLERARLVTEAWQRYADDPVPVKRAKALAHILANMTLDSDTNPIFAGCMSSGPRKWMLTPEHGLDVGGQVVIEHDDLRGFLNDKVPDDLRAFWRGRSGTGGLGHFAIDQSVVVDRGLRSVLDELAACEQDGDAQQREYRAAMRISIEAVIDWAHRWAKQARIKAQQTDDPAVAACHLRVAEACQNVPEHPARNLFEALQAMALVHLAMHIEGHHMSVSIGLPDRALARFGDEAAADPDAAANLCAAFALKVAENAQMGKASMTQCFTIGGADHRGIDQTNALTFAFLEGFDRVSVSDPHLFIRWHRATPEAVKNKVAKMLSRGRSMPLVVTDEPTAGGFVDAGIAAPDAWNYCVIGCNELGIPGLLFDTAMTIGTSINELEELNRVLLDDARSQDVADMPALLSLLEDRCVAVLEPGLRKRREAKARIAAAFPTPLSSALMEGGPQRGCDLLMGMPYDIAGCYNRGFSNAVNALAAIEQLVFENKTLTMSTLIASLRENLADASVVDQLAAAPKWGNDDDRADRWAIALLELRKRVWDRLVAMGLPRALVCHVVRSLHHLDGRRIAASADGRFAGTPVGDSLGAVCGSTTQGPTAMLASVLKLDARRYFSGGTNLNLTLPPSQAAPPVIRALIDGFCGDGGQELQINVLDVAQLRQAREHPERYRDLVVRVAGLSARFIELSDTEQLELIARAEAAAEHA